MGVICSAWVRERGDRLSSAKMTGPTLTPSLVTYWPPPPRPHAPLPYLPGRWRLSLLVALNKDGPGQCSEHLQPVQPRTCGPWRVYVNIVLYFSSSNTVFWNALPNGHMHSTDYCYIF
jgi:hypothetical protein